MGYIYIYNRFRFWVIDVWLYIELIEMLQRNGNKLVCIGRVSDEYI